jgi:putative toxin-antitoxin system antitoxin component (TIGR02293 family)
MPLQPVRRSRRSSPRAPPAPGCSIATSFLSSPAQAQISEIRKGAPASNLIGVAEALRVPRERVYELVGLSSSTAKRKLARDETLDPLMTERLTRIGAIEKLAEDTFGDAELASAWLQTEQSRLGQRDAAVHAGYRNRLPGGVADPDRHRLRRRCLMRAWRIAKARLRPRPQRRRRLADGGRWHARGYCR